MEERVDESAGPRSVNLHHRVRGCKNKLKVKRTLQENSCEIVIRPDITASVTLAVFFTVSNPFF